jgi:short-subunit dehydrogenase
MSFALITGASSGIGLEMAKLFAKDGHSLILVARRKDRLEALAKEIKSDHSDVRVEIIAADLGVPGAGQDLFKQIRDLNIHIDYLVNNAGFGSNGDFSDLDLNKQLQMIDLNVRTLVELTHLFLPAMKAGRHGRILNVGSTAGFQPGPYMSVYYASKAFVNSFSEGLHEELKGTGVSCTVLTPGATVTEFLEVAGAEKSGLRLLTLGATSKNVAAAGYRAAKSGRAVAIPGFLNKIQIQFLRTMPRVIVRKLVGAVNRV